MNQTSVPLSPYLRQLVEENYLLTREAQTLARLPKELQETAVEQSEALRVQAMEQIVSDLLNPPEPAAPADKKPEVRGGRVEAFFGLAFTLLFFYGIWRAGSWVVRGIYHEVVGWTMPVPKITSAYYVEGHKVLLSWDPVGAGYAYRIYAMGQKWTDDTLRLNNQPWDVTRAVVDVTPRGEGEKQVTLIVAAVTPDGTSESGWSNGIRMDLTADNNADTIEPPPAP